jgi:ABC-type dipeptide/oligopeptide/nickel transport system permease component
VAVYLIRRVALAVVVLFGLLVATFFIIHLVPGDPVQLVLGVHATPQAEAGVRHQLFLDRPWLTQFWLYVSHMVRGQFGEAFSLNASVASVIGQRVGPSAALIAYAFIVALLVGVPLAIVAALRPNRLLDNVLRLGTTFVFAMPGFWLGLMLALIFGLALGWFPVSGYQGGIGGLLQTLTLPALTLGLPLATIVVRTLRSSLLEVLDTDYIDAARSRGLREVRIISRHALRNAIMNTLTVLSVNVGFLIGGTLVVEQVFQIPGVGSLLFNAVEKRDYQLVQTLALLAGSAVVLASLVADLTQAALDPRVRLGAGR